MSVCVGVCDLYSPLWVCRWAGTHRPVEPADWSVVFDGGGANSAVGPIARQSNVFMLRSGAARIIVLS